MRTYMYKDTKVQSKCSSVTRTKGSLIGFGQSCVTLSRLPCRLLHLTEVWRGLQCEID